jgi:hypothetical protein
MHADADMRQASKQGLVLSVHSKATNILLAQLLF